jgi:mono/diheme cytochrome c family protein
VEPTLEFDALYASNCSGCHGRNGRAGIAQSLNDATYLAFVGEEQLRAVISGGVPGTPMGAFSEAAGGSLTSEQIEALVGGMKQTWGDVQRARTGLPAYSLEGGLARGATPGRAERGRDAYRVYCARCHGEDGRGGASAGSILDAAFLSLISDQGLRTTIIIGRPDEGTPGWSEYVPGRTMTEQEIADLLAWLTSHRGQP